MQANSSLKVIGFVVVIFTLILAAVFIANQPQNLAPSRAFALQVEGAGGGGTTNVQDADNVTNMNIPENDTQYAPTDAFSQDNPNNPNGQATDNTGFAGASDPVFAQNNGANDDVSTDQYTGGNDTSGSGRDETKEDKQNQSADTLAREAERKRQRQARVDKYRLNVPEDDTFRSPTDAFSIDNRANTLGPLVQRDPMRNEEDTGAGGSFVLAPGGGLAETQNDIDANKGFSRFICAGWGREFNSGDSGCVEGETGFQRVSNNIVTEVDGADIVIGSCQQVVGSGCIVISNDDSTNTYLGINTNGNVAMIYDETEGSFYYAVYDPEQGVIAGPPVVSYEGFEGSSSQTAQNDAFTYGCIYDQSNFTCERANDFFGSYDEYSSAIEAGVKGASTVANSTMPVGTQFKLIVHKQADVQNKADWSCDAGDFNGDCNVNLVDLSTFANMYCSNNVVGECYQLKDLSEFAKLYRN